MRPPMMCILVGLRSHFLVTPSICARPSCTLLCVSAPTSWRHPPRVHGHRVRFCVYPRPLPPGTLHVCPPIMRVSVLSPGPLPQYTFHVYPPIVSVSLCLRAHFLETPSTCARPSCAFLCVSVPTSTPNLSFVPPCARPSCGYMCVSVLSSTPHFPRVCPHRGPRLYHRQALHMCAPNVVTNQATVSLTLPSQGQLLSRTGSPRRIC